MRSAKKKFPGAANTDLVEYVTLQVRTALAHPSTTIKDDELIRLADAEFAKAVEQGETWAVALTNSYRDNVIAPLVEKAREKGVDPVPAIVMQTDLTEAEASALVASLDADAGADSDGDSDDGNPWSSAGEDEGDNDDRQAAGLANAASY
jgi:hypothetical protein